MTKGYQFGQAKFAFSVVVIEKKGCSFWDCSIPYHPHYCGALVQMGPEAEGLSSLAWGSGCGVWRISPALPTPLCYLQSLCWLPQITSSSLMRLKIFSWRICRMIFPVTEVRLPSHRSVTPQSTVLSIFFSPLFKNRSDFSFFPSIGDFTWSLWLFK